MSTRAGGILCKDGWEVCVVVKHYHHSITQGSGAKVKLFLSQVVFGGEVDKNIQDRVDGGRE